MIKQLLADFNLGISAVSPLSLIQLVQVKWQCCASSQGTRLYARPRGAWKQHGFKE